ncbi:unnamed protein product [Notodromas monacha]|uniref:Alpha-macroglobulin-like TED domain-containing protein n=1 Tax=Notodromas monacha TaxID=399045 RepID=A0A7R9BXN6_9CRUS|nr:unnamed protein product [Notodromas monacha]CAG0922559.1 unnamed protein product [Notodromas monacha]
MGKQLVVLESDVKKNVSVTLTAHVVISMHHVMESLKSGFLRAKAATARTLATRFLENVLPSLWCPKPNDIKSEFNRPFIQAKKENRWDALSVEATSYALMVYLQREGISFFQGKIVCWLNSMRMKTGGFISIFDTIIALEALTDYSFRARLRDITEMTVTLEATGTPGWQKGQAIVQLDYAYGVDYDALKEKSPVRVFDLDVKETYRTFRNKSIIDVELCPKYTPIKEMIDEDREFSGSVTIEVENPSGYEITQREAVINVLRRRTKPMNLIDVKVTRSSVY